MKKVCIVFDKLPAETSGGLVTTYERLIPLLKNDYEFEIVSIFDSYIKNSNRFPNIKICNIFKAEYPELNDLRNYIKKKNLLKILNQLRIIILYFFYIPISRRKLKSFFNEDDIVIAVSPATAMFIPKSVKFILEIHIKYDYFFGENASLIAKIQKKLMQKPTLILFRTMSDALKAKKHGYLNAFYVYNFFDLTTITKNEFFEDHLVNNNIIFMGRLSPQKNLFKMLRCAILLRESVNDFHLDIYGTGSLKEELQQFIDRYHLNENVSLKGFCTDKNIYSRYSLQWLTSDYEGLALVIIEAKANGVPTISTNWGDGVFEVIHDNLDGFICDSEIDIVNKTIFLWNNRSELERLSKNALANAREFDKDHAYQNWKNILNEYEKGNYCLLKEGDD